MESALGLGLVTGLAATQANVFLFSQRGRRQTEGKAGGRGNEGRISRSHSLYTQAIFFLQILHQAE